MCCMWCFGELTKLRAYSVMCYVFQVPMMIAGRRQHDSYTHMRFYVLILGNVFVKQRYDTMRFVNKCVWKMCFEKLKIVLIFTVLQVAIRALV